MEKEKRKMIPVRVQKEKLKELKIFAVKNDMTLQKLFEVSVRDYIDRFLKENKNA